MNLIYLFLKIPIMTKIFMDNFWNWPKYIIWDLKNKYYKCLTTSALLKLFFGSYYIYTTSQTYQIDVDYFLIKNKILKASKNTYQSKNSCFLLWKSYCNFLHILDMRYHLFWKPKQLKCSTNTFISMLHKYPSKHIKEKKKEKRFKFVIVFNSQKDKRTLIFFLWESLSFWWALKHGSHSHTQKSVWTVASAILLIICYLTILCLRLNFA